MASAKKQVPYEQKSRIIVVEPAGFFFFVSYHEGVVPHDVGTSLISNSIFVA